jgi:hypothetical protein
VSSWTAAIGTAAGNTFNAPKPIPPGGGRRWLKQWLAIGARLACCVVTAGTFSDSGNTNCALTRTAAFSSYFARCAPRDRGVFARTTGSLRTLELPGKNPLKDAHAALDAAVLDAYGFDPADDLLGQLLALNLQVAARIDRGETVTPPGVPPTYGDATALVTDDCIQP